jgi:hypothetical protein
MQLYLGPGTSQGEPYIPDEMAIALAGEKKLKKGDTISKRDIVSYLEKRGVGALLAPDVAIVLRNMFGVTPTFDEDKKMDLIGELTRVLSEDYNNPRTCSCMGACNCKSKLKKGSVPSMEQLTKQYDGVVQSVFNEAHDEIDQLLIAKLATLPFATVEAIASLDTMLSESDFEQVEACLERGGQPLAEAWFDVASRPHTYRFLQERTQHELMEVGAAPGYFSSVAHARRGTPPPQINKPGDMANDPVAQAKRQRRAQMRSSQGQDPLAARQPGHIANLGASSGTPDEIGDLRKDDPALHGVEANRLARREKSKKKAVQAATNDIVARQNDGPANLPDDPQPAAPGFGARLKAAGKSALGALGDVTKRAAQGISGAASNAMNRMQGGNAETPAPAMGQAAGTSGSPAAPDAGAPESPAERKPGMLRRLVRGAGKLVGGIAKNVGAAALHHFRSNHPVLAQVFGGPGERERRYGDMVHNNNMRKAEVAYMRGDTRYSPRRRLPAGAGRDPSVGAGGTQFRRR